MEYQVNEIFTSIQGEGMHAGRLATFIRLQGCTVGCPWCDTKYTWKRGGTKMSVDDVVASVSAPWVVITGGEPTIWDLDPLISQLHSYGVKIQLETSGQNKLKGIERPDWITWSPKPNLEYTCAENVLRRVNEVKWVVDGTLTLDTVRQTMRPLWKVRDDVYCVLMPEGTPPKDVYVGMTLTWMNYFSDKELERVRFSDRIQTRIGVK